MITRNASTPHRPRAPRVNRLLLHAFLLLAGWGLWWRFGRGTPWYATQLIVLGLQTGLASIPSINRWLSLQFDKARFPTPRSRTITATTISMLGMIYLFISAVQQERDRFPKYHDESMHLIQAQQLARARLWMPAHALPQFFETFHVFVTPVYAAMQFPGTSMLYVPGIWLHLPYWVTSIAIAGASLGLFYYIIAQLIDGIAGILAAMMLLGVLEFRYLSVMVLSNPAVLVLGLLTLCAWIRWRMHQSPHSAILIGIFAGWAAITRPPDALCFALPVGVSMMWTLRHSVRKTLIAGVCLVFGALPFLSIQLIFNHGVTRQWFTSPHEAYVKAFHPGGAYGPHAESIHERPQTHLAQKLDYYDGFVAREIGRYHPSTALELWTSERLPILFKASLPSLLLLLFLPSGLLGLHHGQRWIPFAICPLFISLYAFSVFFASQYCLLNTVTLIPMAILGVRQFEITFRKASRQISTAVTVCLMSLCFTQLPQFNPGITEQYESKTLSAVEARLHEIKGRAVVFFHYQHHDNVHEEPVYNIDSADIDSSRIVRAQDLGAAENLKLIRYYAERQPDRQVYLFNRATRVLIPLGPVTQ